MSKTDKTTPYRVRVVRDGHIEHDHRFGRECDLDKFDVLKPWRTHCGYRLDETWRQSLKHFGRPGIAQGIENNLERKFRRQTKQAIGRGDADNAPTKHLDSAWLID